MEMNTGNTATFDVGLNWKKPTKHLYVYRHQTGFKQTQNNDAFKDTLFVY